MDPPPLLPTEGLDVNVFICILLDLFIVLAWAPVIAYFMYRYVLYRKRVSLALCFLSLGGMALGFSEILPREVLVAIIMKAVSVGLGAFTLSSIRRVHRSGR